MPHLKPKVSENGLKAHQVRRGLTRFVTLITSSTKLRKKGEGRGSLHQTGDKSTKTKRSTILTKPSWYDALQKQRVRYASKLTVTVSSMATPTTRDTQDQRGVQEITCKTQAHRRRSTTVTATTHLKRWAQTNAKEGERTPHGVRTERNRGRSQSQTPTLCQ